MGALLTQKTTPVLSDPQWSDLSPRMQVEIFSNLFKTPGSTRGAIGVGFMLGLTQEERSEVGKQIGKRNRQIMQENLELKDMRLKQLTALMRLDNTQLKQHSVPHQLIFRKTSRRYTRRLRERLDMDYLLCQSRELLTARRFLHRRGIDRSFAGDWGNEMVSLKGPDDGAEPEIFEWKEDSTPSPCTTDNTAEAGAQTSSRAPKSNLALREANREAFINDAGDARTMDPREMTQCRGNPFETSRWLDDSQRLLHRIRFEQHQREQAKSREIPQEGVSGILSLKINDGRAAQIHCSDKIYIERQVVIRPSSCSNRNPNSPKADGEYGMIKHPTFPNVKITVPDVPSIRINRFPPQASVGNPDNGNPRPAVCEQPVQRAIGGAWSYNSVTSRAGPQVSSFARVRENLEAAKRDGEQAGASQPQNQSGAGDARSSGQAANPMPTGVAHPMMYAPPPSRHAMLGRDWDADPLQQYVSLPMIDINAEMDTAGVDGDDIFGMLKIKSPGHSSAGRPAGENVP